jgi:hypothetical protein
MALNDFLESRVMEQAAVRDGRDGNGS